MNLVNSVVSKVLRDYLEVFVKFPDEQWAYSERYFFQRKLNRGDFLLKEGEVAKELGFLLSGLLRDYYVINDKDITRFVTAKNSFVTAIPSFISQQPTTENIVALTDSELIIIRFADLEHLYQKFHVWDKAGRLIMQYGHVKMEERLYSQVADTAEDRYKKLMEEQPELINQVPLQYLASMLGMTPETLSRVRKSISL